MADTIELHRSGHVLPGAVGPGREKGPDLRIQALLLGSFEGISGQGPRCLLWGQCKPVSQSSVDRDRWTPQRLFRRDGHDSIERDYNTNGTTYKTIACTKIMVFETKQRETFTG